VTPKRSRTDTSSPAPARPHDLRGPEPSERTTQPPGADDDAASDEPIADRPAWLRAAPCWAASAALHALLIVVIGSIVISVQGRKEEETVVLARVTTPPDPPEIRKDAELDVESNPEIVHPREVEQPVVEQQLPEVKVDIPEGTPENLSDTDLRANAVHNAIAVGDGAAGPYGQRGRGRATGRAGVQRRSINAVLAALDWLCRHQDPAGGWRAAGFHRQAKGPSTNRDATRYPDDRGWPEADVGVTGLALLAFTGFGYTHQDGEYPQFRRCVKRAKDWLLSVQVSSGDPATDGRLGSATKPDGEHNEHWMYNHTIASMALAELFAMSYDFRLQKPVERATRLILRAQNPGRGWRYEFRGGANDTSVTGWAVLALKAARTSRARISEDEYRRAFTGALAWFDYATDSRGMTGYQTPGDAGSSLAPAPDPYPYSKDLSCMTAVGMLCRLFAGESRRSPAIRAATDVLTAHPPLWQEQKGRVASTVNLYYWYYAAYALHQLGGRDWDRWSDAMLDALCKHQRQVAHGDSEEVHGSWDPIGEWGRAGGRVYSTALGAMTLEVWYRFRRVEAGKGLLATPRSPKSQRGYEP